MIVRKFEDILPSPLAVHTDTWSSFRLLTRDDGMGFSLHETWIQPGTQTHIWYKHHYEAVYCLEGEGEIEPVDAEGRGTGAPVAIKPGVMYALNQHDRHFLRARTRLRLICVFSPPLRGDETHGPDGAYPAPEANGGGTLTGATPRAATPPPDATAAVLAEAGKAARSDPAASAPPSGAATTAAAARIPPAARLSPEGSGLASARPGDAVARNGAPTPVVPGQGLDHMNGDSDDDSEEESP